MEPIQNFRMIFYKYIQVCATVVQAGILKENFKVTGWTVFFYILLCLIPISCVYTGFVADPKSGALCLPIFALSIQVSVFFLFFRKSR